VDVLLGLQWGDEGKGKIIDYLAPKYDVIARFQGGPNAGHTLYVNGKKVVLRSIPSGIFHDHLINIIGNGVVLDPVEFEKEVNELTAGGLDLRKRLLLSKKTHIILPTHRLLDAASEASKGEGKIGSTLKGIGPAYMDKTGRNGLRVGDIFSPDFKSLYEKLKKKHLELLSQYNFKYDLNDQEEIWFKGIECLKSFNVVSCEYFLNEKLRQGKNILAEGAQGSMLDIDFGTYPFVTSSNTISAAACTGLGIAPSTIRDVFGIIKAYCTRVGSGPFPTELNDATGELMRKEGNEFGAVTGRPRRCGWLDLVAVNYTIMLSGVTKLIVTKADVLNVFDAIKVCTSYPINGKASLEVPFNLNTAPIVPQYQICKGWKTAHSMKSKLDLPATIHEYISFIEKNTGVTVSMISIGAGREQLVEV
ncbi:MAG: adenylosuccinate synthase, partial [Chitinophagales bacterium]|nr:adenylosuccinate synthase [Chitinophagales bacterium]